MLSTLFSFSAFAANTTTATIKPTVVQATTKPATQATTTPGTQATATAGTQIGSDQTGSTVAPSVNPTDNANATSTENPAATVQPSDNPQAAATATAAVDTQKDQSPKTGDEVPLFLGCAVLFVSFAAMASVIVMKKKSNR